jgi:hypothetical protein
VSFLGEMLQTARRAPEVLGESTGLVRSFIRSKQNTDGGFQDRSGRSDLYYTVFGLEADMALAGGKRSGELENGQRAEAAEGTGGETSPPRRARKYLERFGAGEGLDFVHLCCLARSWALAGGTWPAETLLAKIEEHRSRDGGYAARSREEFGTAYGAFLAAGAYEDLERPLPESERLVMSLQALEHAEGGAGNERFQESGRSRISAAQALATSAVMGVRRHAGIKADGRAVEWLGRCWHPQGGFKASPQAPLPDLLSTATVLHALAGEGVGLQRYREPCLDFVDSLWTNQGGFHGHWGDDVLDCEYTFYGLLALGCLGEKGL